MEGKIQQIVEGNNCSTTVDMGWANFSHEGPNWKKV